jgi:hypothetical protein
VSILLYLQHIPVLASHIIFFFYKLCLCSVQSEGQIGWNIPWGVLQNQIGIANKYSYTRNNFFPQLGIFCVKGFHSLLFYKRIDFSSFLKKNSFPVPLLLMKIRDFEKSAFVLVTYKNTLLIQY